MKRGRKTGTPTGILQLKAVGKGLLALLVQPGFIVDFSTVSGGNHKLHVVGEHIVSNFRSHEMLGNEHGLSVNNALMVNVFTNFAGSGIVGDIEHLTSNGGNVFFGSAFSSLGVTNIFHLVVNSPKPWTNTNLAAKLVFWPSRA
ncbi:MAG TPA: hypothetical protein VMF06_07920 [Candidatus Limnocylindria bacterium]|nr:hypothetical protein [Candidatus Limnocylindria bacterium]